MGLVSWPNGLLARVVRWVAFILRRRLAVGPHQIGLDPAACERCEDENCHQKLGAQKL